MKKTKKICKTKGCSRPVKPKANGLCRRCSRNIYMRAWNAAHRKQIRTADSARYAADPEFRERKKKGSREWAKANPERRNKRGRAWDVAHRPQSRKIKRVWRASNPETISVAGHISKIHRNKYPYAGMPLFAGWDSKQGGSTKAAIDWVIENIGHRPGSGKDWNLHIIDRAIGFMPGNLCWVPKQKHQQEELVNKLLAENALLKVFEEAADDFKDPDWYEDHESVTVFQ